MIKTDSASGLRYRRLFETARDGILLVDPETRRIVDVNPFLVSFLGYAFEELIGKELFEIGLLKDATARQCAFRKLQAVGHIHYENLPLETKDGRRVEVEFVGSLYHEGEHALIQCNIRDISVRKKTEEAVSDASEIQARRALELEHVVSQRTAELRLSNAQLETFVYTIAHDLRAPLRTMQGFSRLLVQDHAASLSQTGREYANFINNAAQTVDRMLADLLAFSHISQQNIALAPVSLETAVKSALAACEAAIRESDARVECAPRWPVVLAHSTTLRQVLVNLIGNAVKFVANKTPHVQLGAEIRPHAVVRVWVEDNGIGIPVEFQERIFQVFQRLHTTAYPGTGIGLAIVQKVVEQHGGRIWVDPTEGDGSRFCFTLPA